MRQKRMRVFRIIVNGLNEWLEVAGNRSLYETQHKIATETFPGAFVRVTEQYLGGAKAKPAPEDDDEADY